MLDTWNQRPGVDIVQQKVLQHNHYNHISHYQSQSMSMLKEFCYSKELLLPLAKIPSYKGCLSNLSKTSSKREIIDSSTFLKVPSILITGLEFSQL